MSNTDATPTVFGRNLRRLRKARGWSLTDLANEADTNKGYLSELERGEKSQPSMDFMVRLGRALGCSTTEFLAVEPSDFLSQVQSLAADIPEDRQEAVLSMLRGASQRAA